MSGGTSCARKILFHGGRRPNVLPPTQRRWKAKIRMIDRPEAGGPDRRWLKESNWKWAKQPMKTSIRREITEWYVVPMAIFNKAMSEKQMQSRPTDRHGKKKKTDRTGKEKQCVSYRIRVGGMATTRCQDAEAVDSGSTVSHATLMEPLATKVPVMNLWHTCSPIAEDVKFGGISIRYSARLPSDRLWKPYASQRKILMMKRCRRRKQRSAP